MFLFSDTAHTVAAHLLESRSVRLCGEPGSGRTSTLREVVRVLESRGVVVREARGSVAVQEGQVLDQLGALTTVPDVRDRGFVKAARLSLLSAPDAVLVVDDVDQVDPLSAQVLESLTGRVRMLRAVSPDTIVKPVWPEVTIAMPPLGFAQVGELAGRVLGRPLATSLVARILGKSGGNPELVVAIAESALIAGLLERHGDVWHLSAPSLWNEHLRPFAQWRIRGLSADELTLLRRLAKAGPQPFSALDLGDLEGRLRTPLARTLVRTTKTARGHSLVYVSPPLVADLLVRHDSLRPEPVMNDAAAAIAPSVEASWTDAPSVSDDAIAIGRVFQQDAEGASQLLSDWEDSPTPAKATAYLLKATGSRFEEVAIERVFRDTEAAGSSPAETLRFAFQHAQWLACDQNDLTAGLGVLEEFAKAVPSARQSAEAGGVLLRAFLDGMPSDLTARLDADEPSDPLDMVPTTRALIELFGGDLPGARRDTPPHSDGPMRTFGASVVDPIVSALEGNGVDAYRDAVEARDAAMIDRDRLIYIGSSYAAAFASMSSGRLDRVQRVVASTLSTAKATMLLRPFFGATLNVSAINAALTTGASPLTGALLRDAEGYTARPGPLFGTGTDVTTVIARSVQHPREFDRDMSAAVRRRRDLGYLAAAASTAVLAGCVSIGPALAREIEQLRRVVTIPLYARSMRAILAMTQEDLAALRHVLTMPDQGDSALVAQIVGAAHRRAQREGNKELANALAPLAADLLEAGEGSFAELRVPFVTPAGVELTIREREVAALAGHMKNSEIGEQLGISIRTVENHIASSLRKTGTSSRFELSTAVRGDRPSWAH